jgi:hypothetical protein
MPKLKPGTKPMRRITICIEEQDWSKVRFMAYAFGRTPSNVARLAIKDAVRMGYDEASARALSLFEKRVGE